MIPVYILNGFLESGKTEFILFTLDQEYFAIDGTTLVFVCEDGEIAYDEEVLRRNNAVVTYVNSVDQLTPEFFKEQQRMHDPERIIIEWNGMWDFRLLKLPRSWSVEQQITVINGQSFSMYFSNMKSLMAEMMKASELVMFNRCDGLNDQLGAFKKNVKSVNQTAQIVFEDSAGEINDITEEDLPFDINAPVIELDDTGYAIWYIDSFDHPERYEGKTLKLKALAMLPPGLPKGYFVPGREAMTCCAEDIAFLGFACRYDRLEEVEEKAWYDVTATFHWMEFPPYNGEGPVLEALEVNTSEAPEEEVIDFSKI